MISQEPPANLYLVGFMATGKTSFGRVVAGRLRSQFLDSDAEIEASEGMPISEIFARRGEAYFRSLEREFIEHGHPAAGCVVSCGGGLVVQPGMLERLRSKGVVICLQASVDSILERVANRKDRPLLDTADQEARIRALLAERAPVYRQAGTVILTDGRPFADVAEHILRVYRREARDFRPVQPP